MNPPPLKAEFEKIAEYLTGFLTVVLVVLVVLVYKILKFIVC